MGRVREGWQVARGIQRARSTPEGNQMPGLSWVFIDPTGTGPPTRLTDRYLTAAWAAAARDRRGDSGPGPQRPIGRQPMWKESP